MSAWDRAKRAVFWHVARLYARAELPRFGALLDWLGLNEARWWIDAPVRETTSRWFGHRLRLDLSDYHQRLAYFMGGTTELEVLALMRAAVREGDVVLDGGANIGLLTLAASAMVGARGRVHAFEPLPHVLEELRRHVGENRRGNVDVHGAGLGDESRTVTVRVPGWDNWAAGTLGPVPARFDGQVRTEGSVSVVRADDVLDPHDRRPLFVKLDVEGFELRALRGMAGTIGRLLPAIVLEVNAEMLTLNGSTVADLVAFMSANGYGAWALDRAGFRARHRLWLHPLLPHEVEWEKDVLFLHPQGVHWARLFPNMKPRGWYWKHHRMGI